MQKPGCTFITANIFQAANQPSLTRIYLLDDFHLVLVEPP